VKLKRKITLTKEKKIKRTRTKLVKIIYHKFGLKNKIEKKIKFSQRG
jgi:hypothetical protein